jgi:hypothetical protein
VAAAAFANGGCGGSEPDAQVPVARETPEDEILRLGTVWESRFEDRGFRTGSAISVFTTRTVSRLSVTAGSRAGTEVLTTDESFKMTDGTAVHCQARAEARIAVGWGRVGEDAALQVERPALRLTRSCGGVNFPEPVLDLPAFAARFALRGDRLMPISPKTETREYIPGS